MKSEGFHYLFKVLYTFCTMKEEILEDIGFSKNEAKIYLALIELGNATASEVAKVSRVHRTNVYDALKGLIKKGVVSYVINNETKCYEATDPKNLLYVLKEKENSLNEIIPELNLKKQLAPKKSEVHIFEGTRAIKDILEHFLEMKTDRCDYGAPKTASEKIGKGWLEDYHKRRIKKKLFLRHIYNEDAIDRIKYLNTLNYTEVRFLPKEYNSPVSTEICGDEVVLMMWDEQEPIAIQIINEKVANAYRHYFELMWEIAKKP